MSSFMLRLAVHSQQFKTATNPIKQINLKYKTFMNNLLFIGWYRSFILKYSKSGKDSPCVLSNKAQLNLFLYFFIFAHRLVLYIAYIWVKWETFAFPKLFHTVNSQLSRVRMGGVSRRKSNIISAANEESKWFQVPGFVVW